MNKPAPKMSEIYTAISDDKDLPETEAFPLLAAIEFLAGLEGVPVSALNLAAPKFAEEYAKPPIDGNYLGLDSSSYLKWRRVILDLQMRYAPGDVDGCPWLSLGRAFRLETKGKSRAFLPTLRSIVPAQTAPKDLNDQIVADLEKLVESSKRTLFRQDVRAFAKLAKLELVKASGLMPITPITPPTIVSGHINHATMSDEISSFRNGLVKKTDTQFLDFVNRLAVTSGLLNGRTDTLEDLVGSFADLPPPESVGMPAIKDNTLNDRLTRVRVLTALPDPRLPPVRRAWEHLRAQARKMGCITNYLWAFSQCAESNGTLPCDVTRQRAVLWMNNLKTSTDMSNFRRGCEQFDALFGQLASDLLPVQPIGIQRKPPAPPRQPKVRNPVNDAWAEFYVKLREKGWTHADTANKMSALRAIATRYDLSPDRLDIACADKLRLYCHRKDLARLNRAIKIFFLLKQNMDLNPQAIDLPRVSSLTHGGVSDDLSVFIEKYFDEMNFASSSQRGIRVAIGALSDAVGQTIMTWEHVLSADLYSIDWGSHAYQQNTHILKIEKLREWLSLPWTEDWHKLQWAISRAGISAVATPVPKILKYTNGREPADLDLRWAREADSDLRSTIKNPPHGRADLAITLCRNLKKLDDLWSIPALAQSGLLPQFIGEVRP